MTKEAKTEVKKTLKEMYEEAPTELQEHISRLEVLVAEQKAMIQWYKAVLKDVIK